MRGIRRRLMPRERAPTDGSNPKGALRAYVSAAVEVGVAALCWPRGAFRLMLLDRCTRSGPRRIAGSDVEIGVVAPIGRGR